MLIDRPTSATVLCITYKSTYFRFLRFPECLFCYYMLYIIDILSLVLVRETIYDRPLCL